uniref:Secreted protein n=1 Tax=Anguilla anguilla TaxID=7936 RepID=A0A0E9X7U5_ANGAN
MSFCGVLPQSQCHSVSKAFVCFFLSLSSAAQFVHDCLCVCQKPPFITERNHTVYAHSVWLKTINAHAQIHENKTVANISSGGNTQIIFQQNSKDFHVTLYLFFF